MSWRLMTRLGITTRDAEDDKALPIAQIKAMGRTAKPTAILQTYGLHATLPKSTPGLLGRWLGYRESRFFIPTSWRLRRKNSAVGDVVLYQPEHSATEIILRRNGDVRINTDGTHVEIVDGSVFISSTSLITLEASNILLDGDLTVTGDTALGAVVTAGGQDIGKTHTHVHGDPTTGPPNS